jgi:hypothetical protein
MSSYQVHTKCLRFTLLTFPETASPSLSLALCYRWKYEEAFDKTQKYKEGKFILERAKMTDVSDPSEC